MANPLVPGRLRRDLSVLRRSRNVDADCAKTRGGSIPELPGNLAIAVPRCDREMAVEEGCLPGASSASVPAPAVPEEQPPASPCVSCVHPLRPVAELAHTPPTPPCLNGRSPCPLLAPAVSEPWRIRRAPDPCPATTSGPSRHLCPSPNPSPRSSSGCCPESSVTVRCCHPCRPNLYP